MNNAEQAMAVCRKHGADYIETPATAMVGVADNVQLGEWPLNGFRHRAGTTSGWFIYAGAGNPEDEAPDFFKPLHASHLIERCPVVIRFLGLAPGWRFLLVRDHEDVWFDPALLAHEV